MKRCQWTLLALCLGLLAACQPALNWRELVWPRADVKAMLPCKPDVAKQSVQLAGQAVELQMAGCEAGDHLFAVACLDTRTPDQLPATLQAWQRDMLSNLQAAAPQVSAVTVKGASLWPVPVRWQAQGRGTRGEVLQARALWFAKASTLCHAVVYAPHLGQEAVETFFSGIEVQ